MEDMKWILKKELFVLLERLDSPKGCVIHSHEQPSLPSVPLTSKKRVPRFKTGQQAQAWAQRNFGHIEWNIKDMHPAYAYHALKKFNDVAHEYPKVAGGLRKVEMYRGYQDGDQYYPMSGIGQYSNGEKSIILNHDVFSKGPADSRIKNQQKSGFSVQTAHPAEHTITHEFGHAVYYRAKAAEGYAKGDDHQGILDMYLQAKDEHMPSRYSHGDHEEGWAEAFTQHYAGKKRIDNPWIQKVREKLEDFKKKGIV